MMHQTLQIPLVAVSLKVCQILKTGEDIQKNAKAPFSSQYTAPSFRHPMYQPVTGFMFSLTGTQIKIC